MQDLLVNGQNQQYFEEVRDTVAAFLDRCDIRYPRNVSVDPEFNDDCYAECIRRGYNMKALGYPLRVGIDIAGTSYTHLKDKKVMRYIAIYTAYLTYLDDFCQTDEGIIFVSSFLTRFMNNEPQEHKELDDLADVLKEVNVYYRPITASLILGASLNFIASLFLDDETKGMKLGKSALYYPAFTRNLSGISVSYTVFAFPPEMPTTHYAQAIPDICDITNYINDIMSFFKEELQGEDTNYISLVGKTRDLGKLDSLKFVTHNTACAHERILETLKGEAHECYLSYSHGFVGFHALCRRYKLDQLNM